MVLVVLAILGAGGGAAIWALRDQSGSVAPTGGTCSEKAPIKGNISGEDKIFHEPGWRYYDSTVPEACFSTAEDAAADGFRASMVK